MSAARLASPKCLIELLAQAQALGNGLDLVVGVQVGLVYEQGEFIGVKAQVGEENKLYGSITSRDVESALADKGFVVDRRKIAMEPIKELGSFKVTVKIASGVDATIDVDVVPNA